MVTWNGVRYRWKRSLLRGRGMNCAGALRERTIVNSGDA